MANQHEQGLLFSAGHKPEQFWNAPLNDEKPPSYLPPSEEIIIPESSLDKESRENKLGRVAVGLDSPLPLDRMVH